MLGSSPTVRTTGWNVAVRRWRPIQTKDHLQPLKLPRAALMRISPPRIKVRQYRFSLGEPHPAVALPHKVSTPSSGNTSRSPSTKTRIQPSADVVKIDDRLFYLLQPPLESLLRGASLQMPHEPFAYQLSGISFLFGRHAAILADEMGLGKTMQAITAIRLLLHAGQIRSVLLICPKPLVTNWHREFRCWAPEIPIGVIEGNQTRRRWQWNLQDVPVKISNYEALLRDRSEVEDRARHFDLMVIDEAQRIKNPASSSHQVVCSVSRTRSWALTGTPIENSPNDLVGIFEFLLSGYLSMGMTPRRLRQATRDYIVRRTKDEVLTQLPPKLNRDAHVELSHDQQLSYQRAEDDGVVQLRGLGEQITIQHVFELVLRLKQICNFDPQTGSSAKFDRLEADLEEVAASGKKAIVFSQWVSTLTELAKRLRRFGPVEYHGRIPTHRRDAVIEQLRTDSKTSVILMSYGAGSVGLNLQFCEYVFLFDRWWNPAVEDQAINRAHRIGANGPVTVTRFVSLDSIEERIDEILTQKRQLFDAVLADTEMPASAGLSQADIFGLFDLKVPGRGALKLPSVAA